MYISLQLYPDLQNLLQIPALFPYHRFLRWGIADIPGHLENQNLLEHADFTDLLWAVFHLTEELDARQRLEGLPQSDLDHLDGDTRRVFASLIREWLRYKEHLLNDYPYLYSLAVRTNPMNPEARVEVS